MNRGDHGVGAKFLDIGLAELFPMGRCELEPSRKGIASNYRGLQRTTRPLLIPGHGTGLLCNGRGFFRVSHSLTVQPPSTVTT